MTKYLLLLIAYLLGSIPFSFLLGKIFRGQDIRKLGSGNMGTSNAFRCFGKPIGFTVLFADTLKSGLIVFLMVQTGLFDGVELFHPLFYGFASVLGHVFPIWFKFKGGKGVATAFGLLLTYQPLLGLGMVLAFLITEYITRYVSVASTVSSILAFITVSIMFILSPVYDNLIFMIITGLTMIVIIVRHKSNYKRLKSGTENRVKLFDKLDAFLGKNK